MSADAKEIALPLVDAIMPAIWAGILLFVLPVMLVMAGLKLLFTWAFR